MQDHRKLRIWQRAQELCVQVYVLTADFPARGTIRTDRAGEEGGRLGREQYRGIVPPSSRPDKGRILNLAHGEAAEVMSELDVACRLKYRGKEIAARLIEEYDSLGGSIEKFRQRVLEGGDKDE